jgi:hypothetical protein
MTRGHARVTAVILAEVVGTELKNGYYGFTYISRYGPQTGFVLEHPYLSSIYTNMLQPMPTIFVDFCEKHP